MKMSMIPPTVPIIMAAVVEPTNQLKPAMIIIIKVISVMKWPNTTKGPAMNPFLTESDMVTVSIGPGTRAPDNPAAKEVAISNNVSIN